MNVSINALDEMGSLLWNNANGASQGFAYSPFGSTVARNDGDGLLPGFNGERPDPVNQSYNLGNGYRTYNTTLMRFNAPDSWSPFGSGGLNQYAYCEGDPINRSDPSGHMSIGSILGMTLGVAFGILGAVLSFGTAIPAIVAAGGAVTAAQAALLVSGSLGVVADITGVASTATSESNPKLSADLGWASLAFGIASAAAGGIGDVHERMTKGAVVDDLSHGNHAVRGGGENSAVAGSSRNGASGSMRPIGQHIELYEGSITGGADIRNRAVVSTHARRGDLARDGVLPAYTEARYFSEDETLLCAPLSGACENSLEIKETLPGGGNYKNYSLFHYPDDTPADADYYAKKYGVDVLMLRPNTQCMDTHFMFDELRHAGLKYKTIDFLHCRARLRGGPTQRVTAKRRPLETSV